MFKITKTYTINSDGLYCGNCKFFTETNLYGGDGGFCEFFHVILKDYDGVMHKRYQDCIDAEIMTKKS